MRSGAGEEEVSLEGFIQATRSRGASASPSASITASEERNNSTKRRRLLVPIASVVLVIILILSITLSVVLSNNNKNADSGNQSSIEATSEARETSRDIVNNGSISIPPPQEDLTNGTNFTSGTAPGNPVDATYIFHVIPEETFAPSGTSAEDTNTGDGSDGNQVEVTLAPTSLPTTSETKEPTLVPTSSSSGSSEALHSPR